MPRPSWWETVGETIKQQRSPLNTGDEGGTEVWEPSEDGSALAPVDTQASWIVGSDRMDRDPDDTTKNNRAFFNKAKGAFRAGGTTGAEWDDANVGYQSSVFGLDNVASGARSHAEGYLNTASGNYAHVEGAQNQASGSRAHAEGSVTKATGSPSHAEGSQTTASGYASHAEGWKTTASGSHSHAEGFESQASNVSAHAEGAATVAEGHTSHAEGMQTTASGAYSHAEGMRTNASSTDAHAEGYYTTASGYASHAEGSRAVASRYAQHAKASGPFDVPGDAQVSNAVARQETTDATAALLTFNQGADPVFTAESVNVWTLLTNRAHKVRIEAIARRTDVEGEAAGFTWEGVVVRDSGTARIVGAPIEAGWSDAAAAGWTLTVGINEDDAANPYLELLATGEAGKTIRWVAGLYVTEVG